MVRAMKLWWRKWAKDTGSSPKMTFTSSVMWSSRTKLENLKSSTKFIVESEEDEDSILVRANSLQRVKWGIEKSYNILLQFQGKLYILQEVDDFIHEFEAFTELPVYIVGLIESHRGSGEGSACQRRWRCLYLINMSPSLEKTCSGSHEASEIG